MLARALDQKDRRQRRRLRGPAASGRARRRRPGAVLLPLRALVAQEEVEDVLAERLGEELGVSAIAIAS
jgi:hypothetical protein